MIMIYQAYLAIWYIIGISLDKKPDTKNNLIRFTFWYIILRLALGNARITGFRHCCTPREIPLLALPKMAPFRPSLAHFRIWVTRSPFHHYGPIHQTGQHDHDMTTSAGTTTLPLPSLRDVGAMALPNRPKDGLAACHVITPPQANRAGRSGYGATQKACCPVLILTFGLGLGLEVPAVGRLIIHSSNPVTRLFSHLNERTGTWKRVCNNLHSVYFTESLFFRLSCTRVCCWRWIPGLSLQLGM